MRKPKQEFTHHMGVRESFLKAELVISFFASSVLLSGCFIPGLDKVVETAGAPSTAGQPKPSFHVPVVAPKPATATSNSPLVLQCGPTGTYQVMESRIIQQYCVSCHSLPVPTFPLNQLSGPAYDLALLTSNYNGFYSRIVGNNSNVENSLLFQKINGTVAHTGGQPLGTLASPSQDYLDLKAWANNELNACNVAMPSPNPSSTASPVLTLDQFWTGVQLADEPTTLNKAILALVGRGATQAELASIAGETTPGPLFEKVLLNIMTYSSGGQDSNNFYARIEEFFNDIWLTDWDDQGGLIQEAISPRYDFAYPNNYNLMPAPSTALHLEPSQLLLNIVEGDRDFRELVTGQYRMLNKDSASVYQVPLKNAAASGFMMFPDPANGVTDPTAGPNAPYVVGTGDSTGIAGNLTGIAAAPGLYQGEFAGVISTPGYLKTYPNTLTNRSRKLANNVLKQFIGLDVTLNANPSDPAQAPVSTSPAPWRHDPKCVICHQTIDPVAGLFQNWDQTDIYYYVNRGPIYVYDPGSWYEDKFTFGYPKNPGPVNASFEMFPPGFPATVMVPLGSYPGSQADPRKSALAWLGLQISQDPRFLQTMAAHLFQGVTGVPPLTPGQTDPSRAVAWLSQQTLFVQAAQAVAENNYNIKYALLKILESNWFRAVNAATERSDLVGAGNGSAVTPEELDRKYKALLGQAWTENGSPALWAGVPIESVNNPSLYKIFMGGINSQTVKKRSRTYTGLSQTIAERAAMKAVCSQVAPDFAKAKPVLFNATKASDKPLPDGTPTTDANIRINIAFLRQYLLGDYLGANANPNVSTDPQILDVYKLFTDVYTTYKTSGSAGLEDCGVAAAVKATQGDANVIRAWQAVVAYLLQDYEFLTE